MPEKNVNQRLLVIGLALVVGFIFLWPPQQKLRPGLDIAGGTSLIFEIDDTGMESRVNLAEDVKQLLQKRVDPKGVYSLTWRVHGRNRIEVQMPLPPKDAKVRQEAYQKALRDLFDHELRRGPVEEELRRITPAREASLEILRAHEAASALDTLASYLDAQARPAEEREAALAPLRERLGAEVLTKLQAALDPALAERAAALQALAVRHAEVARANLVEIRAARALTGTKEEVDKAWKALAERIGSGAADYARKATDEQLAERARAIDAGIAQRAEVLLAAARRYDRVQLAEFRLAEAEAALTAAELAHPTTAPATTEEEAAAPPTEAPEVAAARHTLQQAREDRRDALERFEDAMAKVLATNLNRRRFQELIDLDAGAAVRKASLEHQRVEHADLDDQIVEVLARYEVYRTNSQFLDSPADLKRLLRGAGKLEFRILAEPDESNPTRYDRHRRELARRVFEVDNLRWVRIDDPVQFFNLDSEAALADFDPATRAAGMIADKLGEDYYVLAKNARADALLQNVPGQKPWKLAGAREDRDESGGRCVSFAFDPIGGSYFYGLTSQNIGKQLCILVDDVAYSSATIQSAIRTQGRITGQFGQKKVEYLVQTMQGGALPARLKDTPLSERTVGSSLGEVNRDAAVRAGLIGACAVVLVMIGYYWFCGAVAVVGLLMNVFLVLAALAMLNARITLDGIAGIILAVGMAVDANVLIYERMREEKTRGASLRMVVKNGYDKALSTIIDSNITTLLTCVIIYYVGSEEVKGFGLTLGWGIVLNLFTSIFVTRTLFALLLKYNILKDVPMAQLIGVPTINWYAKRKYFIPLSLIVLVAGLTALGSRGTQRVFDVEFLGGIAAEIELKPQSTLNDEQIQRALGGVGDEIGQTAARLADAEVRATEASAFEVRVPGVSSELLAAVLAEPLEEANVLQKGGLLLDPDRDVVTLYVASEVDQAGLMERIKGLARPLGDQGDNFRNANVNAVLAIGGQAAEAGRVWNVTTTVTNMRLVEYALARAVGDDMKIDPRISYVLRGLGERPYPITDRLLSGVVPDLPAGVTADLTNYLGGAALDIQEIDPPQSVAALTQRFDNMHFQPDFRDMPMRDFRVIGVTPVADATDEAGQPLYSRVVVVTVDAEIRYSDNPEEWWTGFAQGEQRLVDTGLSSQQTLRRILQFKPQIAARSTQQASLALLLSWGMIIAYVWIRFGRVAYGLAGVVALIHDALIALAFVGFSVAIGGAGHPIGNALLISDFKIDMTIVAAMLTIIGYSINDTIVVFDRIRETRGRLGIVTPDIINASINQTLSRTLMTSITTLVVLVIMYIFGGSSIRGFNFCMMIGIITGSYSSIAIAAPLLMLRAGRFGAAAPRKA